MGHYWWLHCVLFSPDFDHLSLYLSLFWFWFWASTADGFEHFEWSPELKENIDCEVEKDCAYQGESELVLPLRWGQCVCESEELYPCGKDTELVEDLIFIRFLVLVWLEVDQVDEVQLWKQEEDHHLQCRVIREKHSSHD